MHTIYICGNDETICDGYTDPATEIYEDEIARAFFEAAAKVIQDARADGLDVDYENASYFGDWHGGRFYSVGQPGRSTGYSIGLVACLGADVPQWAKDLCDNACAAGETARNTYISSLEELQLPQED